MKRKLPQDAALASGLEFEGFVVAGTPTAFEALGPHDSVQCTRCGAKISYVILTSKGPMGGDCYATLSGDQATRKQWQKAMKALDNAELSKVKIHKIVVEHSNRDSTIWGSTYGKVWNEWEGTWNEGRPWYLASISSRDVAEAIAASIAEQSGLQVEIHE